MEPVSYTVGSPTSKFHLEALLFGTISSTSDFCKKTESEARIKVMAFTWQIQGREDEGKGKRVKEVCEVRQSSTTDHSLQEP